MQNTFHSERYKIFIGLLREVRESKKISQTVLANKLQQPQTFVSKCETGVRRLDVVELCDWLSGLGIEPADFVIKLQERWDAHAIRITHRGKRQLT
ncbi:MAG: transcriptional regulator [Burkholderiales bacterium PBB3]|nr:MAG: transcriptional regulator [Burkholderiales bacterium PBB3]